MKRWVVVAIVAFALLVTGATCQSTAAKLSAIKGTATKLRSDVWTFWLSYGLDRPNNGLGIHGTLDQYGKPIDPKEKGLIQQSRHLWAFSMYYGLADRSERVKKAATSIYKLITTKFLDSKDNRFFYKVDADGNVKDSSKSMRANMYTIAGLARYGRSFNDPKAKELALKVFRRWDALAHDTKNGGWSGLVSVGQTEPPKSQDAAIHILEALTELWQTYPNNGFIKKRLGEAVRTYVYKVWLSGGGKYSRRQFSLNWVPIDNTDIEFGHELVASWMLLNLREKLLSAKIIDSKVAGDIRARAFATMKHTISIGYDAKNGGFWPTTVGGQVDKSRKIWWQQAEGLLALYQMYKATGKAEWVDRLYASMNWVWKYQRDGVGREWFWQVDAGSKKAMPNDWPYLWKGLEWKASYHTGRSTLFLATWLANNSAY